MKPVESSISPCKMVVLLFIFLGVIPVMAAPIDVEGLEPEAKKHFLEILKPRLEYIEQRPATLYRANDAAYLLQRQLLREGFYEAAVDSELIREGSIILLKAKPGKRYTIGEITVNNLESASIEHKEIEAYFLQPIIDRELARRENIPHIEGYRFEGAENAKNFLRSQGYWEAETKVSDPQFDRATQKVGFSLDVRPGSLHEMAEPRLLVSPSDDESPKLQSELANLTGKTARSDIINKVRTMASDFYRSRGFEFATIAVQVEHRNGLTYTTVEVEPGVRHKIGNAEISGLEKTQKRRVSRLFKSLKGELYNREKIDEVISRLLQTGAFESIRADDVPGENGALNLDIQIREAKARGYASYLGAGSFEGMIFGAGYYDRNFRGKLQGFSALAEISGRGLLGEIKLVEPFFLGEDIAFTPRLYIQERTFDEYDKSEAGIGIQLDHNFTEHSKIHLFSDITVTDISAGTLPLEVIGQETYMAVTLGIEQEFDFRNNAVLPAEGFFANGSASVSEIIGEDKNLPFAKFELAANYHHPVSDSLRIAGGVEAGVILPLGDHDDLPIDERFFIGGADSVRSFSWRDLGPRPLNSDINQSVGGEAYWIANLEVQKQLAGPLWGVLFADAGTLSRRFEDLTTEEVDVALGLGLRLQLPIGPVRVEYGHNMTEDAGEPSGSWHFAIGVSF